MQPSTPDPNLFDSLRRKRAELRDAMSELEMTLAAPPAYGPARWVERVRAALDDLAADLAGHIEITEGADGLYHDILATAPRLSGPVERLTEEHAEIKSLLERVVGRTAAPGAAEDVAGIRDLGTSLLGRLTRHRQQGADLVFEAFETDIGGET